jgi:hypothetical protein
VIGVGGSIEAVDLLSSVEAVVERVEVFRCSCPGMRAVPDKP